MESQPEMRPVTTNTELYSAPQTDPLDELVAMLEASPVLENSAAAAQYWLPSYDPSQTTLQQQERGVDIVDEKLPFPPTGVMLFTSTYNLTASASKRLNIGILAAAETDDDWCVLMELENVSKNVKVQFTEHEWCLMERAESYIKQQMCTEHYPNQDIYCGALTLTKAKVYDDNPALCIKSRDKSIYLLHSTVTNLFDLGIAISCVLERLNQRISCVKTVYKDIVNYLQVNNVHSDDLYQCITKVPKEPNGQTISLREIQGEFCAHKKTLFAKFCTGVKENDFFFNVV